jgi:hypothetical protein
VAVAWSAIDLLNFNLNFSRKGKERKLILPVLHTYIFALLLTQVYKLHRLCKPSQHFQGDSE